MFTKYSISRVIVVCLHLAMGLVVLIGSAAYPATARALGATLTVTTDSDNTLPDGLCSLREAITNANNNAATYGDCAAGLAGSGDVIIFSSGLGAATINLGSTLPEITDNTGLTIDGGNAITLSGDSDGNGTGDVQLLWVSSNTPLTLENLVIAKGFELGYGGAITSDGLLTLDNVMMRDNASTVSGGALHQQGGTLTISNSIFKNNTTLTGGAAIFYDSGNILIQDSTFQDNTTTDSNSTYGAISGDGTLTLTIQRSTFASNVAKVGGAIFFSSGTLNVENSTFDGNGNASGGVAGAIYASDGTLNINNSTIANNLANGIMLSTVTLNLRNTILAANTGNDCYSYTALPAGVVNNNLIETLPASPNNCGLSTNVITDLGLGPLADNGGPTMTRALLAGSQALDAGDNASCATTDQRGAARPLDGNADTIATCDIGALEVRFASATTITSDAPDYSMSGAAVTVHVNVSSSHGTPTGIVNVISPNSNCVVTLSAGSGSCVLHPGGASIQTIFALYPGDPSRDPSSDTERHTVAVSTAVVSIASQDGWVLEASQAGGVGGSMNSTGKGINLGDDVANRQYRGILSFNTGARLPNTAIILAVRLRVRKMAVAGGLNPVTALQGFILDVRKGAFGTAALQPGDFQAAASHSYGPFLPAAVSGWYSFDLTAARAYVNKLASGSGLTQIRLHFKLDDNNNATANLLTLFSGGATPAYRPQLVITYYVP